jgi:adenylate kinase
MLTSQKQSNSQYYVIFVLGYAGSGKGTLCGRLAAEGLKLCLSDIEFGDGRASDETSIHKATKENEERITKCRFRHLSVGELLRREQERQPQGELAHAIQQAIRLGQLIPPQVSIGLLQREIAAELEKEIEMENKNEKLVFLIDGFPSSIDRMHIWNEQVGVCDGVVYLDCPQSVLRQRLLSRGRSDDTEECIARRNQTFETNILPVVRFYEQTPLFIRVDTNSNAEIAFSRFVQAVKAKLTCKDK